MHFKKAMPSPICCKLVIVSVTSFHLLRVCLNYLIIVQTKSVLFPLNVLKTIQEFKTILKNISFPENICTEDT